jgi:hypothetical protein
MKPDGSQRKPAEFRWPPKPTLRFYDGRGKVFLTEANSGLDLFDALMLFWQRKSRTVCFGVQSCGRNWPTWTEPRLKHVERLIKYDLNFDGCDVSISRVTKRRWQPCTREFRWKLKMQLR